MKTYFVNENNLILKVDSYKSGQYKMYPAGMNKLFSYAESRGGVYPSTVFFGLQYLLLRYLDRPVTVDDVNEANEFFKLHGVDFNYEGWMYIAKDLEGKLPVRIRAVPEGSVIPVSNILMSIESTDPKVPWIVNWLETLLLKIWYPTTVATQSHYLKQVIYESLVKTADDPDAEIAFKLHSFGYRGVSSEESAAIGGAAELLSFMGTDTLAGIVCTANYYDSEINGFSINASEHSCITSWGREHEVDAYSNMIDQFGKPGQLFACVSDSYDIFKAITDLWGGALKEKLIASGGTLVIRPDCYDDKTEILTENGFKLFKDLTKSEKVAQYYNDGTIEYVLPEKYFESDYEGEMIHFKNANRLDLMVTPNHRVVYEQNGKIKIEEASKIKTFYNKKFLRTGKIKDKNIHMSPFEKFLVAFQADGSYQSGFSNIKNPGSLCGHITVRFNFEKKRKEEKLIQILKDCNFHYVINEQERKNLGQNVVYVQVPIQYKIEKFFKDWVFPETRDFTWCKEFIQEISHWDVTRRTDKRYKYDSTIKENSEIVQLISFLSDSGATLSEIEDNRKEHFNNIHTVTITNNERGKRIDGQSVVVNTVNYSGKIYCVKVSTGMLVVRRNKKIVISGNSGHPLRIVPQCLKLMDKAFGHTINSKGYKVINHVKLIQGDGVNPTSIREIINAVIDCGYSMSNVAFGMGGASLQGSKENTINRDTQKFAFKASYAEFNGVGRDVFKDPVTDPGKQSKKGLLDLVYSEEEETYKTVRGFREDTIMKVVYENGVIVKQYNWDEVKKQLNDHRNK